MRMRRMLIVCAGAAVALSATAVPAGAAAPSPQGCTFDKTTGRTTCVTTTSTVGTQLLGPFTGSGPSTDGSLPGQRCLRVGLAYYSVTDAYFTTLTFTTTTTTYQGRSPGDGSKVTSDVQSSTEYLYASGASQCSPYPV